MDEGIIQNFKTMYRAEVVRLLLDSIDEKHSCDWIAVLTAMQFANKAWNHVTQ